MARHNKKRNVGLIYEQLIVCISRALVNNESKKVNTVKKIIEKRFAKNTQLYKEFRLFNALIRTSGVSESLATRILSEAQKAAQNHNSSQLDKEKSALIKEINYRINESDFYDQRIGDYVHYATIQTLLNNWRSSVPNLRQMAEHESKIHGWLCRDEKELTLAEHSSREVNDLTVAVMEKKFEKKYGTSLSDKQKVIMHLYLTEKFDQLENELSGINRDVKHALRKYKKVGKNKFLLEKTMKVQLHVEDVATSVSTDGVVGGMVLCQLLNELNGEING